MPQLAGLKPRVVAAMLLLDTSLPSDLLPVFMLRKFQGVGVLEGLLQGSLALWWLLATGASSSLL